MTTTSQQNSNNSTPGSRKSFATRWRLILLLGPLVYLLYWLMPLLAFELFGSATAFAYPILVYCGPALIFLGAMFLMHRRFCFPDISFVGNFNRKSVILGVSAVTVVYLATYAAAYWLGQPRELIMVNLYKSKTDFQVIVLIVSMLLLVPVVEELAFRHFLLSTLPFNANVVISWVAVSVTALIFAYAHSYIYLTTKCLIFAVGMIFGIARVRSGGLLLPIILHTYAIAFGLACDQVVAHF